MTMRHRYIYMYINMEWVWVFNVDVVRNIYDTTMVWCSIGLTNIKTKLHLFLVLVYGEWTNVPPLYSILTVVMVNFKAISVFHRIGITAIFIKIHYLPVVTHDCCIYTNMCRKKLYLLSYNLNTNNNLTMFPTTLPYSLQLYHIHYCLTTFITILLYSLHILISAENLIFV